MPLNKMSSFERSEPAGKFNFENKLYLNFRASSLQPPRKYSYWGADKIQIVVARNLTKYKTTFQLPRPCFPKS